MAFATVAGYIYRRLRATGMTIEAVCALLAQIQKESGFICNNVENGKGWTDECYTIAVDTGSYKDFTTDEIGYGLYQLTYSPRKRAFLNYIRNRGCSIADLEAQVDYLIYEMQEAFPSIWRMMLSSHDLFSCTKELLYKWENPQEKEENLKERYTYAQKWLDMAKALEASGELNKPAAKPDNDISNNTSSAYMGASTAVSKVLTLAKSELGYHEKANNSLLDEKASNPGSGNFTKYGRDLDAVPTFYNSKKNGYAWCDQFVDWLFFKCFGAENAMQMLCQPQNSAGAGCENSKNYYQSKGQYDKTPHIGDQIFFYDDSGRINHTGIVESISGGYVNTIEGNSTDRVQRQSYPIDSGYIAGYGHPRWEVVGHTTPVSDEASQDTASDIAPVREKYLLYEGMVGKRVELLQTILTRLGYDVGPDGIDGEFGIDTKYAVMSFQNENGLEVSGGVDDATTDALNRAYSALTATIADGLKFKKGDVVAFVGSKQYLNSTTTHNRAAKPGTAKITRVKAGDPHPYHLVKVIGGGSNIYGWANEEDVSVKI